MHTPKTISFYEPRLLLTGFRSFDNRRFNPTELLMDYFQARKNEYPTLQTVVLDVAWRKSEIQLSQAIERSNPDIILSFGLMGAREFYLEKWALNKDEDVDSVGETRPGTPIVTNGPERYPTTLPIEKIRLALEQAHYPALINDHPSTYLCNHAFYYAAHLIQTHHLRTINGFIHVPNVYRSTPGGQQEYSISFEEYQPHGISYPAFRQLSMSLERFIQAVELMITTVAG